ncbi:hypothetical protein FACS189451_12980 [Bacteroidia bacterium]|nr:hypothetical protein FACS189446_7620 [Bacteroidia bacterium]GHT65390.1 hypothetical protein FACS189451_12980 [Bacteroidia bacterium]
MDERIPSLEKQITQAYEQTLRSSSGLRVSSSLDYTDMIHIEYRITGVRNLQISSLDAPLFGKPKGESLNDFFDIVLYDPKILADKPTKNLILGESAPNSEFPRSIKEWLSYEPLGQPNMYIKPNAPLGVPLPVTARFVVKLETDDGKVLMDTTKAITITN